MNMMIVLD